MVRKSENEKAEIWWDRSVVQQVESNRPGVVVVNRNEKKQLIVDFAVPSDRNVTAKQEEKTTK